MAETERRAALRGCPAVELCVDDDNPARGTYTYIWATRLWAGTSMSTTKTAADGSTMRVAMPGVLLRRAL